VFISNVGSLTLKRHFSPLILSKKNKKACQLVLAESGVKNHPDLVPGSKDLSENFVSGKEVFGPEFEPPCNLFQESVLRKNRNLFTAGEDNLGTLFVIGSV
jgi:hypothetical protein